MKDAFRSIATDDLAVVAGMQIPPSVQFDRFRDETHAAVGQGDLNTAWMKAALARKRLAVVSHVGQRRIRWEEGVRQCVVSQIANPLAGSASLVSDRGQGRHRLGRLRARTAGRDALQLTSRIDQIERVIATKSEQRLGQEHRMARPVHNVAETDGRSSPEQTIGLAVTGTVPHPGPRTGIGKLRCVSW